MVNFLVSNVANIIIGAIVLLIITLVIIRMVHNKRKGISDCAGCSGCSAEKSTACHCVDQQTSNT